MTTPSYMIHPVYHKRTQNNDSYVYKLSMCRSKIAITPCTITKI